MIEQTNDNVAAILWPDQASSDTAHGDAVADHAERTALAMGLTGNKAARIRLAGTVHDIGKQLISDDILDNPGPLDAGEWAQVRLHPVLGEQILLGEGLGEIAPWVRSHHERFDGHGYPDRLAATEIPIEARILAVADAYDAMVSTRPYTGAIDAADAQAELRTECGAQFDSGVVVAFLSSLEREVRAERAASARESALVLA